MYVEPPTEKASWFACVKSLVDKVNCKEDCLEKDANCIASVALGIDATKPSLKKVVAEIGDREFVKTLLTFARLVS